MTFLKAIKDGFKGLFKKSSDIKSTEEKLISSFNKVKDEFEEHLYAINENTSEIQYNYSRLYEIENKVEHLNEKIEHLTNLIVEKNKRSYSDISFNSSNVNVENNHSKIDLSLREQEIFAYLYVQNENVSILSITKKIGLRKETIFGYLESMKNKGIGIYFDDSKVKIDDEFKRIHTKNQVVKLSPEVLKNAAMV
ncbi:MAG: hypothetical protein ACOCP4_02990 [Candidatus Woesearchaeota archaeon]